MTTAALDPAEAVASPAAPRRESRQFLRDNTLATASTLVAGALGLLVQATSSHALQPAAFGKAFAVYSLFTLVTRPSSAFGRLQAWQTSRDLSTSGTADVAGVLLRQQTITLVVGGTVLAGAFSLAGSMVGGYLHVPVTYIAAGAFSIPFLYAVQPLLGILQGEQRFVPWSLLSVLVNLSRFVLVLALMLPFGAIGFLLGNTLAAAATFVVCLVVVRRSLARGPRFEWRPTLPFMVAGLVATLTMGVFQGTDVIMVEHFFDKVSAGQYSAVTSIGSAVFFASGGVASAVFPMIAARQARQLKTTGIMGAAFGLCFAAGAAGTVGFWLFGHLVLTDFAGAKYLPGTHYLAAYGVGMGLLAWASVLTNTLQSYNSMVQLWILVPAMVLRPLLLLLFHHTLLTVVVVGDVTIGLFTLSLSVMYLVLDRRVSRAQDRPRAVTGPTAASLAPGPSASPGLAVGPPTTGAPVGRTIAARVSPSPLLGEGPPGGRWVTVGRVVLPPGRGATAAGSDEGVGRPNPLDPPLRAGGA